MLFYLPVYYPPVNPTHQLVYVPPPMLPAPTTTPSPSGPTPPDSPTTPRHPTDSPHRASLHRPPAVPYFPSPVTGTPRRAHFLPRRPPPPHVLPSYLPPTPLSNTTAYDTTPHGLPQRPLPRTHHSNPFAASSALPHGPLSYDDLPPIPHGIPPPIVSHAEILSRSKIRSCHLATDHDCILRKYEMTMRQQPVQARMCGVGEKCESATVSEVYCTLWPTLVPPACVWRRQGGQDAVFLHSTLARNADMPYSRPETR